MTHAATLATLIDSRAGISPNDPAILGPHGQIWTYAGLCSAVRRIASNLQAAGAVRTSRVALITPNGPSAALGFLGISSCCACAPLNPAYRAEEIEFYLRDIGATLLVTTQPEGSPALAAAARAGVPVLDLDAAGISAPAPAGPLPGAPLPGAPGPDDIALLLHTSGTTAKPKLVPLLNSNLLASAHSVARTLQLSPSDRCLNIMPLFHIHGLVAALLASLASGASVICTDGAYGTGFFGWLNEFSPTWYTAVPTMHMGILAAAPDHAGTIRNRPLRLIRSSSAALPPKVLTDLETVFHAPVIEAYGMTEAAHQMASNPLPPSSRKPGSVGPAAGPDVAVMDENGTLAAPGVTGEVVIRGPNVMPGYLDNPEANHSAFTNGWFRTGDQGLLDEDGYLHLTGRLKELINRGGEKIAPREIDEVLLGHPGVQQALAFALPHERLGEEVAAVVVPHPDAQLSESALIEFAARRLAAFKVPRVIKITSQIPMGPTGKPQRVGLAAKLGLAAIPAQDTSAGFVEPATAVEREICRIWSDLLRKPRIGVLDTFESLGGDSLLAARMLAAVAEQTRLDLPFSGFIEHGTIRSIADEIERARTAPAPGTLIEVQSAGSRPPMICLPGHDGITLGYAKLSALLGPSQPLYILPSPDPAQFPQEKWTIEEFARAASSAILERFGRQNVILNGICFGGVLAYETARLLTATGAKPELLILLDTLNPAWRKNAAAPDRLLANGRMALERIEAHFTELRNGGGARVYLRERLAAFLDARDENRSLAQAHTSGPSAASCSTDSLPVLRRLAASNYQPGPYAGRVFSIRVRGLRPSAPMLGWTGLITGPCRAAAVGFCPRGMLAEPAINDVALHLRKELA